VTKSYGHEQKTMARNGTLCLTNGKTIILKDDLFYDDLFDSPDYNRRDAPDKARGCIRWEENMITNSSSFEISLANNNPCRDRYTAASSSGCPFWHGKGVILDDEMRMVRCTVSEL
jgi:hypothetical protein